jgi:Homeodomain-like domain
VGGVDPPGRGDVAVATMAETLARWHLDEEAVREQIYQAAHPRERERWHALWLLARGWPAAEVATALGRDPHTVGAWLDAFEQGGPPAVTFAQTGGSPPRWKQASRRR